MEFRQIRYFLEIRDAGTFQKAAVRLGLTQPALSRQIFLLEKELGAVVFERGSRQVRLTHEGEVLSQYAVRLRELWEELKTGLKDSGRELSGEFSISAGGTVSAWILPEILKKIRKDHPDLILSVREGDSLETKESILLNEVDLGILTGTANEPGLVSREFLSDRIVPVAPRNHSIFRKKKISIRDLKEEAFVFFHPASAIRKAVEKKIRTYGKEFRPKIGMELRSVESVIKSIEAGLGIGFLSEYSLTTKLRTIPISELFVERKFYLCHKRTIRPGLSKLTDELIRYTKGSSFRAG
ncbi:LysR family transcriptional regulator [Leptospira gomenensis]|uniref:LysR family transcriptional regulator n=1 Tax=Leptospira gomenensis TaxID=2484974 RepID=A0A5F1YGN2_9LEPT|nr:LysR family transcriptional regulator [Leptospira gomenensis]TGK32376.1 LysR family transcriptional regulator [Leptospira gomenensis]TGK43980.1 LysR family transcriptional regulator [Leptospira gomenensis]TGK48943.1 LysR family transcriptional regulator [Leptospira gomenensis]TGK54654.1 LysR family transcriptional regulator [Leptospira gomenensis]